MKDNFVLLYTQIISIIGTFIVTIASVIITQIFYSKNQEKKEQKEDERNRRKELKEVYEHIMKYISSVPLLAPKDIIKEINDKGQYDDVYIEKLKEFLEVQANSHIKDKGINENDLKNIYRCIYDLSYAFYSFENSEKIYDAFRKNYINIFNMYAPYHIKLDLIDLNITVLSGFTNCKLKDAGSFVKLGDRCGPIDNIEKMKINLMCNIRKDLGVKK